MPVTTSERHNFTPACKFSTLEMFQLLLKTEIIPQCTQRLCHFFTLPSAAREPIIHKGVELHKTIVCLTQYKATKFI